MSSYSKYMVRAKEYLKIDPLVLRSEIVTEAHNLVHMVTVVAHVLAQIASSCLRQVVYYLLWRLFSLLCRVRLTGTEFTSKRANRSNHVNRHRPNISALYRSQEAPSSKFFLAAPTIL